MINFWTSITEQDLNLERFYKDNSADVRFFLSSENLNLIPLNKTKLLSIES